MGNEKQQLAHAWAASRRKAMLWGWILEIFGIFSGFGIPYVIHLLQERGIVSEELIGSWWRYQMEFNILTWYLLLGLVFYLALDRISFLGLSKSGNSDSVGQSGILKAYAAEFSSALHLVGLLILPSTLLSLLYYVPIGTIQSIEMIGVFHGIASEVLLLIDNLLNFALLLVIIVGLSLFINRIGILRCAALGVLINLLADKLDQILSFRLQMLATDIIGINAANPKILEQGMVYMLHLGSLVVYAVVFGAIFWLLNHHRADDLPAQPGSPLPADS